jgi:hypothetical protein
LRALSIELARRGATVLLDGRSDMRLADITRQITEATGIEPPAVLRRQLPHGGVPDHGRSGVIGR